ncbi:MAG: TRAP transporter small permease [bacterium]|nr:TRAP transporter small permease [bacterium]
MKNKITLKGILTNLDAIITGVTLSICVVLVNANVIMRYFLNSPIHWAEEVVTSLFVWTVFIGSAYAYRKHSHLGVDIVINMLPEKVKGIVKAIMSVVELLVLIMLTVISSQYVYHLIFSRSGKLKIAMTDLLRVPKWWTGIAVPIGFGLSVIYSVYFMVKNVRAYLDAKRGAVKE